MGFETRTKRHSRGAIRDNKAVPMGFETRGVVSLPVITKFIIKQSLWDLKLSEERKSREVESYNKAVPMGFETMAIIEDLTN